MGRTGPVYYLVAGRWFSAPGFTGPWTFATPNLPAEFKKIPLEHPRSRVLASVPGTEQAAEGGAARAGAADRARQPEGGEGAGRWRTRATRSSSRSRRRRSRAPSTPTRTSSRSATCTTCASRACGSCRRRRRARGRSPTRSRRRSTRSRSARPRTTSPTSRCEDDERRRGSTFAAAAAYTGVMIAWGCAVWGTGYYHPPYWGWGGGYPVLLPALSRPTATAPAYNPWTGGYGRGAVAYGPYGGAGVGARYNPRTGTYARGAAAYGPVRRARRGAGLQPAHRHLRARRARGRTSTAAGDRPACSAATTGRRPRA